MRKYARKWAVSLTMLDNMTEVNYCYSVLMTVYAREKPAYFEQAIRSMLFQTDRTDDFVIVCDGPLTPQLDAVISHYTQMEPELFHIIRCEENLGSGTASRMGLLACKNELIVRMDSDDIAVSDRARVLLDAFRREPELAAVGGQMAEFVHDPAQVIGYRILPTEPEELRRYAASRSPLNNITVMLRKSAAIAVGNYSDIRTREDYELWIRLLGNGYRIRNLDRVLAYARVGEDMYERRRGLEYSKYTVYTEKVLLEFGFINRLEYCFSLCARFVASVLLPKKLSYWLFRRFMRKSSIPQDLTVEAGGISPEVFGGAFTDARTV